MKIAVLSVCFLIALLVIIIIHRPTIIEHADISPLSKSELEYIPERWNRNDIQPNNNCYAYVTNDMNNSRLEKPHPGFKHGIKTTKSNFVCDVLSKNILLDYPDAYKTTFDTPCRCGYYKAYLATDPGEDFHLYRQDSSGFWSHKPGSLKATDLDASRRKITNPETSDKTYKNFNYTDSCMFFCMPSENKSC